MAESKCGIPKCEENNHKGGYCFVHWYLKKRTQAVDFDTALEELLLAVVKRLEEVGKVASTPPIDLMRF